MNKILLIVLITLFSVNAETLFEVKDGDNTVLEVATDGLRIFNMGDTLMVISSSEIKAFIDESAKDKALSRSFSVTTSGASGKGQSDVVNIAPDGLRVYSDNANLMDITSGNITAYIDTSYSFNVTSSDGGKLDTDVLEVSSNDTKMREGTNGNEYTDFSGYNIFLGLNAGETNSNGLGNVFIGNESGRGNTDGIFNAFLGYAAGYGNTTGGYNTFFGFQAGFNSGESSYNTSIGFQAGYSLSEGQGGTYVGFEAGEHNTGRTNVFIGSGAGYSVTTGQDNVAVGAGAAGSNDFPSFLAMTGSCNTFLGKNAGWKSESGRDNVIVGYQRNDLTPHMTGSSNVHIGYNAGNRSGTGSSNVFLGHYAGYFETGSDKLYISNSFNTTPLIYGDFSTGRVGFGTKLLTEKVHIYAGPGESALRVYAANTTRLKVNSDGSVIIGGNSDTGPVAGLTVVGDVGIGTITPSYKLHSVNTVTTNDSPAVYGIHSVTDNYGIGVQGVGRYRGVYGYASSSFGTPRGVYGYAGGTGTGTRYGVYGYATGGDIAWAGYFSGNVNVTGTLSKGAGSFKIDHPLDPENKYLYHSFVESPDMKNIYDGVIILDVNGEAIVNLPDYFGALNDKFRYQLTAIGTPSPNLYIAQEISDNQFKIAGGISGMKVSWMVTGIRKDNFANTNRIPVEVEKNNEEKGHYLHPESFGKSAEQGIDFNADRKTKK